jgi:predicted enzyme related to lactoylglutathione lyase
MPERTEYAAGTPSWVDLMTPDVAAAAKFYGEIFGWSHSEIPDAGGYGFFFLRDKMVSGVGPMMGGDVRTTWSSYVNVDDADKTTELARAAGATVVAEPMDVFESGRMAFFLDPTGAAIGLWQPKEHKGAQLANEPGAFCWNELRTRDLEASKSFYADVFGWVGDTHPYGDGSYTEFKIADAAVAGCMEIGDQLPADVPPHWQVYFAVEDTDATVSKAQGLGATVVVPPMDVPAGRFAELTDPLGAPFGIIKL